MWLNRPNPKTLTYWKVIRIEPCSLGLEPEQGLEIGKKHPTHLFSIIIYTAFYQEVHLIPKFTFETEDFFDYDNILLFV